VIECYNEFLTTRTQTEVSASDRKQQLEYHTLYLLQVLTLDRGTTSGLLVHNENDLGIMGSLPSRVDRELLLLWRNQVHQQHSILLGNIVAVIPESGEITDGVRLALAQTVRSFYQKTPDALRHQASGHVVPPTVQNHK